VTFEGEITLGGCTPFKELYSYGNILKTPFEEIWNGPLFRYNRQRTRDRFAPNSSCAACHANTTAFFDPRSSDARVIRLPLLPKGRRPAQR
jgi:MoaA/NifB/PqqE/SkfB family radical SAM enzyme